MATTQTVALSFRIRTDIANKLEPLAQLRGVTESRLVEELLQEEARRVALDDVDAEDPYAALDVLFAEVKKILQPNRGAPAALNEDATLHVFNAIKASEALLKTYTAAIVPAPKSGLTPAGRRRSVNQQIGRFVKTYSGNALAPGGHPALWTREADPELHEAGLSSGHSDLPAPRPL